MAACVFYVECNHFYHIPGSSLYARSRVNRSCIGLLCSKKRFCRTTLSAFFFCRTFVSSFADCRPGLCFILWNERPPESVFNDFVEFRTSAFDLSVLSRRDYHCTGVLQLPSRNENRKRSLGTLNTGPGRSGPSFRRR